MPIKIIKKNRVKNAYTAKIPWDDIKADFFKCNLEKKNSMTFLKLAAKHKLNIGTLQNRAAKEKWYEELNGMFAEGQDAVDEALLLGNKKKAIAKLQAKNINDELAVRQRHLALSRKVMMKAMAKIDKVDPDKLSVREALDFMRFGVENERKALGMVDDATLILQEPVNNKVELTYGKVDSVIGSLIEVIQGDSGVFEEVEPAN